MGDIDSVFLPTPFKKIFTLRDLGHNGTGKGRAEFTSGKMSSACSA
jgi:hypothetical protein